MERARQHHDRAGPVIPRPSIVAWSPAAPWPSEDQIEQDLALSRLIVEIANDPYLGEELVFRGGTCSTSSTSP